MGVPKGSFYHYFVSKDTFVAALVEPDANYLGHKREHLFNDESKAPLELFARGSLPGVFHI